MQRLAFLLLLTLAAPVGAGLPERLSQTGLGGPSVRIFEPRFALWSDGAAKRRWIALPAGAAIDASNPAAWQFPSGTHFRKEFSVGGRRIETRTIERLPAGTWQFRAYIWNDAQDAATLAPAAGANVALADGSRYRIPSQQDCLACHEGGASPVLGFSALQLSPDRDPLAPHAEPPLAGDADLPALAEQDRIRGLPPSMLAVPPRIQAPTPAARAALGYLNANCGHCHADPALTGGAVPVELRLAINPADPESAGQVLNTLTTAESRYRPAGAADSRLVVPGDAQAGTLLARMRSRDPRIQMPPLGTRKPDSEAIALIERWIEETP